MDFISKLKDQKPKEKSENQIQFENNFHELERLKQLKKDKKAVLRKLEAQALKEQDILLPDHYCDPVYFNDDLSTFASKSFIESFQKSDTL